MHKVDGAQPAPKSDKDIPFMDHIDGLLKNPILIHFPITTSEACYKQTKTKPSWTHLRKPPTIAETLKAWHLTKKQVEFAILILDHFHKAEERQDPKQLLALSLGVPGMGKS